MEIEEATLVATGKELAIKDSALIELTKVESGIADLREKYFGKIYEVSTTAGMEEAKKARAEVREPRYKIPKIIDGRKKEIKGIIKDMEAEGQRIEKALREIEDPIDTQIKDEENRKEREKEEKAQLEIKRIAGIQEKLVVLRASAQNALQMNSEEIADLIQTVRNNPVTEEVYQEFIDEADMAQAAILNNLEASLEQAKAKEAELLRIDAERAELEILRANAAEAQKIIDENNAKRQKELDEQAAEQQRLLAIENEKLEKERAEIQRQKDEADQKEADRIEAIRVKELEEQKEKDRIAEEDRIAKEKQDKIDRQLAGEKALKEEKERKRLEKEKKLLAAKCKDASTAFNKIIAICNGEIQVGDLGDPEDALKEIAIICEANL